MSDSESAEPTLLTPDVFAKIVHVCAEAIGKTVAINLDIQRVVMRAGEPFELEDLNKLVPLAFARALGHLLACQDAATRQELMTIITRAAMDYASAETETNDAGQAFVDAAPVGSVM